MSKARRLPVGAELQPGGGVHFRVWCPGHDDVAVVVAGDGAEPLTVRLELEANGYAVAFVEQAAAGDRYRFRLDGELLADPASRFQPDGPFGPSQVVDPASFAWTDQAWAGCPLERAVIYEMHCGTFTREGTWRAAAERLPDLAELGITVVEVMPVSEFPGRFGWGYDGVFPYAPTRLYGSPDDFRAFVDAAHVQGLAVILDVVYNHLGPDGCVFRRYAAEYFTSRYECEWGDALNFDGPGSHAVREYFVGNAGYWIDEYHLDGLRLDATQSIFDASDEHVIAAIARRVRAVARGRFTLLVSENEPQQVRMVHPLDDGGYGLDALWNDDFHHSAVVAMTGRREAYYTDHRGSPQELISAAKYGYLFQGQRYAWQEKARGTSTRGVPPAAFVNFIENHDQIANSGAGSRMHQKTTPGRLRAMTALFLLMPGTPMLFQGQEMAVSSPFLYFADHDPELARSVQKGRAEFVAQFPSLGAAEVQATLAAPHDPATFERCKLDWGGRHSPAATFARALHQDLLRLRRTEPAFHVQRQGAVDGALLIDGAFVLRFFAPHEHDERLLVVNLDADVAAGSFAEPLVAPPGGSRWVTQWSSEHPRYGGCGTPGVVGEAGWRIPGHSAVVLAPETMHGGH
jgi:maltooligosyltrehalose trehalohydrolase